LKNHNGYSDYVIPTVKPNTHLVVATFPITSFFNYTNFVNSVDIFVRYFDLHSLIHVCYFNFEFKNSGFFKNQKDIRDIETFSHDEVKIIELRGCIGNWFEIEFVMNVLKYAQKLEQIVVMSSSCNCGRERMRERIGEKLQSLVGLEKLVFI
jgi:hypothetical protein